MERDLVRLIAGLMGCVALYQSFDSFRTLRSAKQPDGNIAWGLIALFLGCVGLACALDL